MTIQKTARRCAEIDPLPMHIHWPADRDTIGFGLFGTGIGIVDDHMEYRGFRHMLACRQNFRPAGSTGWKNSAWKSVIFLRIHGAFRKIPSP